MDNSKIMKENVKNAISLVVLAMVCGLMTVKLAERTKEK
jgi:hypothetical protein